MWAQIGKVQGIWPAWGERRRIGAGGVGLRVGGKVKEFFQNTLSARVEYQSESESES